MENNHHPSTLLSMDSSASSHEELDLEMNRQIILSRPPDINLPLSAERSPPPQPWNPDPCDILDVGLGTQGYETETFLNLPKVGRKCAKRVDSIWGAWFFFSFYFKPSLNEKYKAKIVRDSNGVSGFDKSDLKLDVFMVQHDMENMYMWVFKERPENALGKMQLRSYMNGHSRQGERPFPFSVDKGFVRSHRMQRKHYRGLSNPQCVHGIEVVHSPNLMVLDEDDRKRWIELTGRDLNFTIPPEASDFSSWRNLPNTDFELERPPPPIKSAPNAHPKKLLNGSGLNLSTHLSNHSNGDGLDLSPNSSKKRKDFFPHGNDDLLLLLGTPLPQHSALVSYNMDGQSEASIINGMEGMERSKGREMAKRGNGCDLLLRLLAFALTLSAAIVIGVDKQTTVVPIKFADSLPPLDVPVTAKWHYLSAFVYFLVANATACIYGGVSMLLALLNRGKSKVLLLGTVLIDALMVALLFSGNGAATAVGVIGYQGNSHLRWNKVCGVFDRYCHQVAASIILSFLGSVAFLLLTLLPLLRFHRTTSNLLIKPSLAS